MRYPKNNAELFKKTELKRYQILIEITGSSNH